MTVANFHFLASQTFGRFHWESKCCSPTLGLGCGRWLRIATAKAQGQPTVGWNESAIAERALSLIQKEHTPGAISFWYVKNWQAPRERKDRARVALRPVQGWGQASLMIYWNQMDLRHLNVLQLHGLFHDSKWISLILKFSKKGVLYQHLGRKGLFLEWKVTTKIAHMASALKFLLEKDTSRYQTGEHPCWHPCWAQDCWFRWSVHAPSNWRKTMCVLMYRFLVGGLPFDDTPVLIYRRIVRFEMRKPDFPLPKLRI